MTLKMSQVEEIKYYETITMLYGEDIYHDCMHLIMIYQSKIFAWCVWGGRGGRGGRGKGDVNMWGEASVLT